MSVKTFHFCNNVDAIAEHSWNRNKMANLLPDEGY
jgi:hypothetical protein